MNYIEAVEHTKNKKGMKCCLPGLLKNVANCKGRIGGGYSWQLEEVAKHYTQARTAWLTGDLKTVAEFFGLYTGGIL